MATRTETRVKTDPRISRRRKAVARSKRRRIIGSALGVTLAAGAVWGVFFSPLLDVRKVQVHGAKATSAREVRAAADLGADDNLLLLSTSSVVRAVEALPWVDSAEVDRRLPGTVRIKVEERKAALVVTVAAGTWTVDRKGHVLEEGAASDRLPILTGIVLGELEPGEQLATDDAQAGLKVWRSLPKSLRNDVSSVVAPAAQRIAVALRDGTLIRYGGPDRLRSKNEVVTVLLRRLKAQNRRATYIDVSVPATPAVGPAPAVTPGATPLVTPTP